MPTYPLNSVGYTEGVSCYHSTTQSIPNNTNTTVSFDSEKFDTDDIHDPTTNNSRLTCQTAGKYLVWAIANWYSSGTGLRAIRFKENGSTTLGDVHASPNSVARIFEGFLIVELSVGDYVEFIAYQNSGGAINLNGGTGETQFGMQRVG